MAASADGSREVYSFTSPRLNIIEPKAVSQWYMGGLYAISPPLLRGRIQFPSSSILTATMASRGSPLVWKCVNPRIGRSVEMLMMNNSPKRIFFDAGFMILFIF